MIREGRQWASSVDQIREDHTNRYRWAGAQLQAMQPAFVFDAGCGVGYGSYILAQEFGLKVIAVDASKEAIGYARHHFAHPDIEFRVGDLDLGGPVQGVEAAVCFEALEHLQDPVRFLRGFRKRNVTLFGSVPNEAVTPFDPARHTYHHRHYTAQQLIELFVSLGWDVTELLGQKGKREPEAAVSMLSNLSSTLVFKAVKGGAYNGV